MTLTNKQIDELINLFKVNQFLKSKTDKDDFLDNLKRDGFWVHDNVETILTALEMAKTVELGKPICYDCVTDGCSCEYTGQPVRGACAICKKEGLFIDRIHTPTKKDEG